MEQSVIYSVDERNIATVTLNRAEKHNAFDDEMINELTSAFLKKRVKTQTFAHSFTAEGKDFSAGADLNWMRKNGQLYRGSAK